MRTFERVTFSITSDIRKSMREYTEKDQRVNWSGIVQKCIENYLIKKKVLSKR